MVSKAHPRSGDRIGLLRADQPIDLHASRRTFPLVPPPDPAGRGRPDGGLTDLQIERSGAPPRTGLLRGQRDAALRPAVAALRSGLAPRRTPGRPAGLERLRAGCL